MTWQQHQRDRAESVGSSAQRSYGYAGFFKSGNDSLDLALGGLAGGINTDPAYPSSNLQLSSNNDVILKLDSDGDAASVLRVKDNAGL